MRRKEMNMKTGVVVLAVVLAAFSRASGEDASPTHPAPTLDLTTNLLKAKTGSWTRRHAPDGHIYTNSVRAVKTDGVVLQMLHTHSGHIRSNKLLDIPFAYLRENAIDPLSEDAVDREVEFKGVRYLTRAVPARIHDSPGLFFITDAVPVTGILRVDVSPANGAKPYTLWNDAFGDEPDALIEHAGPGHPANAEFGIPMPDGG